MNARAACRAVAGCLFACALPSALSFPVALLHGLGLWRNLVAANAALSPNGGAWQMARLARWPEGVLAAGLAVAATLLAGWRPAFRWLLLLACLASTLGGAAVRWFCCVWLPSVGGPSGDAQFAVVVAAGLLAGISLVLGLPGGWLVRRQGGEDALIGLWAIGLVPAGALGVAFMVTVWFPFTDTWGLGADGPAQSVTLDALFFSWGAGLGASCLALATGGWRSSRGVVA